MSDRAKRLGPSRLARAPTSGLGIDVLRSILDTAHEAFIAMDEEGRITEFNREAERTFGFRRDEVIGRDLADMIVPERLRTEHRRAVRRFLETGEAVVLGRRRELSALHREGHEFPVEITLSRAEPKGSGDGPNVFHAFLHDISQRRLAEQALVAMQAVTQAIARAETPQQATRSLLAALGESLGWTIGAYWALVDGVLVRRAGWRAAAGQPTEFEQLGRELRLDPDTSFPARALSQGVPVWVADYGSEEGFERLHAARRSGLHTAVCVPVVRQSETVGVIEFLTSEIRMRDPSMLDALGTIGRQVGELLGVLEDRQALLSSLERLALTDQLTGLPNRRAWEEGLERELARAARGGHELCVAVIDLDDFKQYNDRHGHQAGDGLLRQTADAWHACVRASDLLARYGGEEFAALIPAWPLAATATVVDRLRTAMPEGRTCSAGVASWNRTETGGALFGRADAALYAAKRAGRNRTVWAP
ncbi:MAG: GGDEF domain-containing protein [Solirubrobacteraceae bacterium]